MPNLPNIQVHHLHAFEGHRGSIFAMAVDETHHVAYTSGDDGIVAEWHLHQPQTDAHALMRTSSANYAMLHIEPLSLLVIGSSDGTVYIFDLQSKKLVHTYRKFTHAIYNFYYEPVRKNLWILMAKGGLNVFSLLDFKEKGYLQIAQDHLRSVVPYEQYLYIGCSDHHIRRIHIETGSIDLSWKAHQNSVFSLDIHQAGKYLISGGRDAHLNVWDLQDDHKLIKSLPAHYFTVNDLAFSPQGDFFVTASRDKTIKLWDAYSFDLLKVVDLARHQGHKNSVNRIWWLKQDNSVLSCSDDRRVLHWKFEIEQGT
ncbi:MAG: hypothetical protein AAFR59_03935 [Bacteroidota bacterium]